MIDKHEKDEQMKNKKGKGVESGPKPSQYGEGSAKLPKTETGSGGKKRGKKGKGKSY